MKRPSIILILALFLSGLPRPAVPSERAVTAQEKPAHRAVVFPGRSKIVAEVADTPQARQVGLMFRDKLPAGGGMLFIFEQAGPYMFWMKNCKFPIDIIWLNEKKEIIYISEKTPPCKKDPCPNYGPSNQNALYVLEVASGFTQKEKLKLGMKVKF